MEKYMNNPIWQVISNVETDHMNEAKKKCGSAKIECDKIREKINIPSKKGIDNLIEFISAVDNNQPKAATAQLQTAKDAFKNHIIPHLQREEEEKQPKKKTENKTNSSQEERTQKSREDVKVVADRFKNIYDHFWPDAHDELEKHLKHPDEKKTVEILLEVVKRAFTFSEDEAKRQLLEAELCANYIVKNGQLPEKNLPRSTSSATPHELLRRYRYLNAQLSIPRLIKEFHASIMKFFCSKHIPAQSRAINEYATACIEVTWLLCTEDPPVHMVPCKESDFDSEIYIPCIKNGKKIDFIVWPALQHYENGPILAKGFAKGKN